MLHAEAFQINYARLEYAMRVAEAREYVNAKCNTNFPAAAANSVEDIYNVVCRYEVTNAFIATQTNETLKQLWATYAPNLAELAKLSKECEKE